jgi:Rha family phage regulatory protein
LNVAAPRFWRKTFADSRDVAATFGKNHRDVLRAIRELSCSEDFRVRNFAQSSFLNEQDRDMPCFEMTRDGFTRLVDPARRARGLT